MRKKPTKARRDALCRLIADQKTRKYACEAIGIVPFTLRNWLKKGREDMEEGKRSLYTMLVLAVEEAENEAMERIEEECRELDEKKYKFMVMSRLWRKDDLEEKKIYEDKAENHSSFGNEPSVEIQVGYKEENDG